MKWNYLKKILCALSTQTPPMSTNILIAMYLHRTSEKAESDISEKRHHEMEILRVKVREMEQKLNVANAESIKWAAETKDKSQALEKSQVHNISSFKIF